MPPHSLTLTMVGASLLWVGWFGFNAGSNLEANGVAALAFANTWSATAAATLSWYAVSAGPRARPRCWARPPARSPAWWRSRRPAASSARWARIVIGLLAGFDLPVGRQRPQADARCDDSLDVFGVHGVGGILGALLTGVFASRRWAAPAVYDYVANKDEPRLLDRRPGLDPAPGRADHGRLVRRRRLRRLKIVDLLIGLRVTEEEEREGPAASRAAIVLNAHRRRRVRARPRTVISAVARGSSRRREQHGQQQRAQRGADLVRAVAGQAPRAEAAEAEMAAQQRCAFPARRIRARCAFHRPGAPAPAGSPRQS